MNQNRRMTTGGKVSRALRVPVFIIDELGQKGLPCREAFLFGLPRWRFLIIYKSAGPIEQGYIDEKGA